MGDWYDRDGEQIPSDWWDRDKHGDEYDRWPRTSKRVGNTWIRGIRVSTVWLGLDRSRRGALIGDGLNCPLIFETAVFGGPHDLKGQRYHTEEEAMRGHLVAVDAIRNGAEPFPEPQSES